MDGRRLLVTGATAGLGFFSALELARLGATVVLAGRSAERLDAAERAIRAELPDASIERLTIDTADLASVRAAADELATRAAAGDRLDGMMLNAGLIHTPRRRETSVDGHELTLATNALGHFALVARALRLGALADGARIVWLGSMSTRLYIPATTAFGDPQLRAGYGANRAYAQSKLAAQVLGVELDRRLRAAGSGVESVLAHPGYSIGGLTRRVEGIHEPPAWKRARDLAQVPLTLAQGKEAGARSQVAALVSPQVRGGDFVGPRFGVRGAPAIVDATPSTYRVETGERLWRSAVEWTGEDPGL